MHLIFSCPKRLSLKKESIFIWRALTWYLRRPIICFGGFAVEAGADIVPTVKQPIKSEEGSLR